MRLGFISDLHFDYNMGTSLYMSLINQLKTDNITHLIIAGDINNSYKTSFEIVERIEQDAGVKVFFVLGNHDYYDGTPVQTIREEYFAKYGLGIDLGSHFLIGDTGWYDYRWLPTYSEYGYSKVRNGQYGYGVKWPDHRCIKSEKDVRFDQYLNKDCIVQLNRQAALNIEGKPLIVISHMIPNKNLIMTGSEFESTNCYFGGQDWEQAITALNPEIVVFGHTHFSWEKMFNNIEYFCSPVGYKDYEWVSTNAEGIIKRRLNYFDLS